MDPSCLVTTVQAGGGCLVWRIFSWHTLGTLVLIGDRLNVIPQIPQISINCKMLSYQFVPEFLKNVFSTLLNQFHVELRQFYQKDSGE